jgi:hypothetical protein
MLKKNLVKPSILSIGNIIRDAYVFNFKNWCENTMINTDSLLHSVACFFTLLQEREVEYVLVGGIAILQYVEGRNTQDIDIIMALESMQQLPEIVIISQDEDFIRGQFETLQIDFLLTNNPLFHKVKQEYTTINIFMEQNIPCANVEGLLLLKLYALPSLYRQGNFARVGLYENDIGTLIHDYQSHINIPSLLTQLIPYLSDSDLHKLDKIVDEIQERIKRFDKNFNKNI